MPYLFLFLFSFSFHFLRVCFFASPYFCYYSFLLSFCSRREWSLQRSLWPRCDPQSVISRVAAPFIENALRIIYVYASCAPHNKTLFIWTCCEDWRCDFDNKETFFRCSHFSSLALALYSRSLRRFFSFFFFLALLLLLLHLPSTPNVSNCDVRFRCPCASHRHTHVHAASAAAAASS